MRSLAVGGKLKRYHHRWSSTTIHSKAKGKVSQKKISEKVWFLTKTTSDPQPLPFVSLGEKKIVGKLIYNGKNKNLTKKLFFY